MTKKDIISKVAQDTGLHQTEVAVVVQKTLDYMADELASGNGIEFRDFGVFTVVTRKQRTGRDPKHPADDVIIPEHTAVKFKAGKELAMRVLKLNKG